MYGVSGVGVMETGEDATCEGEDPVIITLGSSVLVTIVQWAVMIFIDHIKCTVSHRARLRDDVVSLCPFQSSWGGRGQRGLIEDSNIHQHLKDERFPHTNHHPHCV